MLETFDINKQPIKDVVEWIGKQWNDNYGIWKIYVIRLIDDERRK